MLRDQPGVRSLLVQQARLAMAQYVRAGGLVVENGRVLVTVNRDEFDPVFYLLPGGGQQFGETLPEAVRRELLGDTGFEVAVHELAFVREYISADHEFAGREDRHHIEFYFRCSTLGNVTVRAATFPDTFQTGVAWITLEELAHSPIYPKALQITIPAYLVDGRTRYLGDVN